jgi:hypothetical protein
VVEAAVPAAEATLVAVEAEEEAEDAAAAVDPQGAGAGAQEDAGSQDSGSNGAEAAEEEEGEEAEEEEEAEGEGEGSPRPAGVVCSDEMAQESADDGTSDGEKFRANGGHVFVIQVDLDAGGRSGAGCGYRAVPSLGQYTIYSSWSGKYTLQASGPCMACAACGRCHAMRRTVRARVLSGPPAASQEWFDARPELTGMDGSGLEVWLGALQLLLQARARARAHHPPHPLHPPQPCLLAHAWRCMV